MITLMVVLTTLMFPDGATVELNLIVPYDEPLTECIGEIKAQFNNRRIDLMCLTMGNEVVDIEITGAFKV